MKTLKALFPVLAALTVAASFVGICSVAYAGDVYKATLTSTGGTSSNSGTIVPHLNYHVQCDGKAKYQTGTSTVTVGATARNLPAVEVTGWANSTTTPAYDYELDFNAGAETKVAILPPTSATTTCYLYQKTQ
jgi:hypothetical protein